MPEVELGPPPEGQWLPMFRISIGNDPMGPLVSPVIMNVDGTVIALDEDGQLVFNGQLVSGSLSVDSWYTPFITSNGHLRVRREDGQLEPYKGPDAVLEEPPSPPAVLPICGREASGSPGIACVLVQHPADIDHKAADGRRWPENPQGFPIEDYKTGTCKAALMIRGEHFPCDWQYTSPDGTHKGWGHTNKRAEAIWSND